MCLFIYFLNQAKPLRSVYLLFVIIIFTLSQKGYAQIDTTKNDKTSTINLKKILLGSEIGFEYESKINDQSTISFLGGCEIVSLSNSFFKVNTKLVVAPKVFIQYRNYYNLKKRNSQGRRTTNNNGNYFLIKTAAFFPTGGKDYYYNFFVSQGLGITRYVFKRVNIDGSIGISERFSLNDKRHNINYSPNFKILPLLQINLVYIL